MGALHSSAAARHRDNFTVTSATDAGVRIAVAGALTLALAGQVEGAFNTALDSRPAAVLVDLSAVTVVDARVLQTLLRIVDQAYSPRLEFRISAAVQQMLDVAGVKAHLLAGSSRVSLARPGRSRRRRSRLHHAS